MACRSILIRRRIASSLWRLKRPSSRIANRDWHRHVAVVRVVVVVMIRVMV